MDFRKKYDHETIKKFTLQQLDDGIKLYNMVLNTRPRLIKKEESNDRKDEERIEDLKRSLSYAKPNLDLINKRKESLKVELEEKVRKEENLYNELALERNIDSPCIKYNDKIKDLTEGIEKLHNKDKLVRELNIEDMNDLFIYSTVIEDYRQKLDYCYKLLYISLKIIIKSLKENSDNKFFFENMDFIIGKVFKLRVEIVTDIILNMFNIKEKQDTEICKILPIPSRRTPDFVTIRNNKLLILETNFSSSKCKGYYSKGDSLVTSKYYEEIYYASTRLGIESEYFPLIFFDGMFSNDEFNSLKESFIEGSLNKDLRNFKNYNLVNFFIVLNHFSSNYKFDKEKRETNFHDLEKFSRLINLVNKNCYPNGKFLNRCFTFVTENEKKMISEWNDELNKLTNIVEFNENMYLKNAYSLGLNRFLGFFSFFFEKEKHIDRTKIKKSLYNFDHNMQKFTSSLNIEDENLLNIISLMKNLKKDVEQQIGLLSIERKSFKELLFKFNNRESIKNLYFNIVKRSEPIISEDSLKKLDIDKFNIPTFRYITDPELPLKEEIFDIEIESRLLKGNNIRSITDDISNYNSPFYNKKINKRDASNQTESNETLNVELETHKFSSKDDNEVHSQDNDDNIFYFVKLSVFINLLMNNSFKLISSKNINIGCDQEGLRDMKFMNLNHPNLKFLDIESYYFSKKLLSENEDYIINEMDEISLRENSKKNEYSNIDSTLFSSLKELSISKINRQELVIYVKEEIDPLVFRYLEFTYTISSEKECNLTKDIDNFFKKIETKSFRSLKFNILEKNYLKDFVPSHSEDYVLKKTKDLMGSSDTLFTKKIKEIVYDDLIIDLEKNLEKSNVFYIESVSEELKSSDWKYKIFEDFEKLKLKKYVDRKLANLKDPDEGFSMQGIKFYKDHFEIKDIKLSYRSKEFENMNIDFQKLIKKFKLKKPIQDVINHCEEKKKESEEFLYRLKAGSEEKEFKFKKSNYVPSKSEIENLEQTIKEDSSSENFSFTLLEDMNNLTEEMYISKSLILDFENILNSSMKIKTYYRISKLYESLSFESVKWRIGKNELVMSDENFGNIFFLVLESNKITNDLTKKRYMMFKSCDRNMKDYEKEISIFKNKFEDMRYTNVHEEDIDQINYRKNLFSNLYCLFFYFYRKNIFDENQIKEGFILIYNFFFNLGSETKNIISVFKYLNVIGFADYANVRNLFEKYFLKKDLDKTIHFLMIKRIVNNFNSNRRKIKNVIGNELSFSRYKKLENIELDSLFGKVNTVKDLIECNTFYNLVCKKTTNKTHDLKKSITTILENNHSLIESNEDGENIDNINEIDIINRKPLYCNDVLYYSLKYTFENIFDNDRKITTDDKVLNEQFERVKESKFLDKEFFSRVCTNRIYSNFSSQFLSKRKSLRVDRENYLLNKKENNNSNPSLKCFMIDSTYDFIEELFGAKEIMSPTILFEETFRKIEKNVLFKGVKIRNLCNLSTVSLKIQHENNREIVILFIASKILTVFIQNIYYCLNSLIEGEMVVKSTLTKYEMLKKMTNEIYELPKDFEIVYMNGDMAQWSGTDIYSKFSKSVDMINTLNFIDVEVLNMLKFSFEMSSKFKVIIPSECKNMKEVKNDIVEIDNFYGEKVVSYEKSWPQGIYHNPSSFIHASEQLFKNRLLKKMGIISNKGHHKFVDHSDDKNELIAIKNLNYENYVNVSNKVSLFFSLKSSLTKDSFSRLLSEMVGLQNLRGFLFDNPVKSINNIISRTKDPFFILNYKSSLSSISEFYSKSNDLITSNSFNILAYSNLSKIFSVPIKKSFWLPLDLGGFMNVGMDSFNNYSIYIDYIDKFTKLMKKGISLDKMIRKLNISLKPIKDKKMRSIYKKLSSLKKYDKLMFDIEEENKDFKLNILRSKIDERIEMFRQRDSINDIMNVKNKNINKIILNVEGEINFIPYNKLLNFINDNLSEFSNEGLVDQTLILNDEIVSHYDLISRRKIIDIHKYNNNSRDIRELNLHTLIRNSYISNFVNMSFLDFKDIIEGNIRRLRSSYSFNINLEKFKKETFQIISRFKIFRYEDFNNKETFIEKYLDCEVTKNNILFKPINYDFNFLEDFFCEFEIDTEKKLDYSDIFEKSKIRFSKHHNNKQSIKDLKSYINRCLIDNTLINDYNVREIVKSNNTSINEIIRYTNNSYIKYLLMEISGSLRSFFKGKFASSNITKKDCIIKRLVRKKLKKDEKGNRLYEGYSLDILINKSKQILDIILINEENEFLSMLRYDQFEYKAMIKETKYNYLKKRLSKSNINDMNYIFEEYEKLGCEIYLIENGMFLKKTPNNIEIVFSGMQKTEFLKRERNIVKFESFKRRINIYPEIYEDDPQFKRLIINKNRIKTTNYGGELFSKYNKSEQIAENYEKLSLSLTLKKRTIESLYTELLKDVDELDKDKITKCFDLENHNHSTEEDVICIKTNFSNAKENLITSNDIRLSMEEIFDKGSIDINELNKLIAAYENPKALGYQHYIKHRYIRYGMNIIGNNDFENMLNLKYRVPVNSNDLYRSVRVLERNMKEILNNSGNENNKLLFNSLRSIIYVINRDKRFLHNLDFSTFLDYSYEEERQILNEIRGKDLNHVLILFGETEQYRSSRKTPDSLLVNKLINTIGEVFDFSDNEIYRSKQLIMSYELSLPKDSLEIIEPRLIEEDEEMKEFIRENDPNYIKELEKRIISLEDKLNGMENKYNSMVSSYEEEIKIIKKHKDNIIKEKSSELWEKNRIIKENNFKKTKEYERFLDFVEKEKRESLIKELNEKFNIKPRKTRELSEQNEKNNERLLCTTSEYEEKKEGREEKVNMEDTKEELEKNIKGPKLEKPNTDYLLNSEIDNLIKEFKLKDKENKKLSSIDDKGIVENERKELEKKFKIKNFIKTKLFKKINTEITLDINADLDLKNFSDINKRLKEMLNSKTVIDINIIKEINSGYEMIGEYLENGINVNLKKGKVPNYKGNFINVIENFMCVNDYGEKNLEKNDVINMIKSNSYIRFKKEKIDEEEFCKLKFNDYYRKLSAFIKLRFIKTKDNSKDMKHCIEISEKFYKQDDLNTNINNLNTSWDTLKEKKQDLLTLINDSNVLVEYYLNIYDNLNSKKNDKSYDAIKTQLIDIKKFKKIEEFYNCLDVFGNKITDYLRNNTNIDKLINLSDINLD